jgi:hypothetical protein
MIMNLRLFQWGLAGFLAVIDLAEIITPAAQIAAIAPQPVQMPAAANDTDTAAFAATWSQIALARPLFSPNRRPVAAAVVDAAPVVMPKLSAIVVTSAGAKAIFVGDDGKPLILGVGGAVGGDTITSITPAGVVVTGPSGRTTLRLQFGATDPAAPAAPAAIGSPIPPSSALLKHLLLDNE